MSRKKAPSQRQSKAATAEAHRTKIVWGIFLAAMTFIGGILLLADGSMQSIAGGPMLGPGVSISDEARRNGLFELDTPLDHDRWQGIMVHHSGSPAGNATSLDRQHKAYGLDGMGYHFVIGNGNGMDDGIIHLGERWLTQAPGAHTVGPDGPWHNKHSIAICLIGNGETRSFTDQQLESLIGLINNLQQELGISAGDVRLHRDVTDVKSPGRYFPEAAFRERLLTIKR